MNKPLTATVIAFVLVIIACRDSKRQEGIVSGRIDYNITYLNHDIDKKTKKLLPAQMKMIFNENASSNVIDGFMGMYRISSYTDYQTRKCSTLLKIFEKEYFYQGSRDEQVCCFDTMDDMEVTETDDTKIIAGFLCRKAIIKLPSRNESFSVYYTDEITIRHPNTNNPYKKIKGVLMEFELKLLHLNMRFMAESYQPIDSLNPDPEYHTETVRDITRGQMTDILTKLLE